MFVVEAFAHEGLFLFANEFTVVFFYFSLLPISSLGLVYP